MLLAINQTLSRLESNRVAYTVKDAAEAVNLKPHVIQDAISRGELMARKRGRYWLIRRDYLWRWLEAKGA